MNRRRQRPTVKRLIPSRRATSLSYPPSLQLNTIRARSANACAVVRRLAHDSSVSLCSALTTNGAFGRPVRMCRLLVQENGQAKHIVLLFLTQDTSGAVSFRGGGERGIR